MKTELRERFKKETNKDWKFDLPNNYMCFTKEYVEWLEEQVFYSVVRQSEQLSDEPEYCNKHKWNDCECTGVCRRGLSIT